MSITEEDKQKFLTWWNKIGEEAIGKAKIDNVGIQNLIKKTDTFQEQIVTSIQELSESQFADEEEESSYTYPEGYIVKGIAEQVKILRELFPSIGFADESVAEQPLPQHAEGWFAIPRWQTIDITYGEAVEKVLDMISKTRDGKFGNPADNQLGVQYLRQHARTVKMWEKIGDQQKGFDILVVPAQFGLRHRGRSVRRAREVFEINEFGLGVFAVGIMLLTHPEREIQWEQLHVDCAGDEFAVFADGDFWKAPLIDIHGDKIRFNTCDFTISDESGGSASAFLLEEK